MKKKGTIRGCPSLENVKVAPLLFLWLIPTVTRVDPSFEFGGVKDVDGIGADSDSD